MSINLSVTVDANGSPTVIPDELRVRTDKNVKLVWEMETEGYEISDIAGLPTNEFSGKSKHGTGYEIKDKNDKPDTYKYTIVVNHLATGRQFAADPTIKNEG